jgi:hypothetical protein
MERLLKNDIAKVLKKVLNFYSFLVLISVNVRGKKAIILISN